MVTVMVTSHKVTEKNIEILGKMMSYNIYNIWLLGTKSMDLVFSYFLSYFILFYFYF